MASLQTPPAGWWQASDGKWYPPAQHPDYKLPVALTPASVVQQPSPAPSLAGLPLLEVPPPPSQPGLPPSPGHSSWKWLLAAAVVVGALLLVGGVLLSHGSSPKTSASSPPTSNTVNPIQVAATQFEQYANAYTASVKVPDAAIAAANADITKQDDRLTSDQTTVQNNEFGTGCGAGDPNFSSCYSQEQQTAAMAQTDETAAQTALKNDAGQIETADQQAQNVISTFVQQLDAIAWPTSLAHQDSSQLEQSLTNERDAANREATDYLNDFSTTQDNQDIATAISQEQTEVINLATALGIPPPPAPATT